MTWAIIGPALGVLAAEGTDTRSEARWFIKRFRLLVVQSDDSPDGRSQSTHKSAHNDAQLGPV
ncbi:hypothetical protein HDV64DRAFT_252540 [Trichoderma sp. TUCIM 5745]